jgi:hypothetical protein
LGDAADYWYWKSTESEVISSSTLNVGIYEWANENCWALLPIFYLISYISHSIPDFAIFFKNYSSWFEPSFAHFWDQIALYTFSDRTSAAAIMDSLRVRAGFYQTAYTSLIIDFGLFIFFLPILFFFISLREYFLSLRILLLIFLSLSLIENYFFQGLKPLHYLYFMIFFHMFVKRNKLLNKK